MRNIPLLLILLLIINNGCSQDNHTASNWLSLEYDYSNGPVSPQYQYRYTIKIDNKMNGSISYSFAYDRPAQYVETKNFTIDEERMKLINEAIIHSKVMSEKIESLPTEKIPDGGHIKYFSIILPTDDNQTKLISVPSHPVEEYQQILNNLYDVIDKSVPDDIWKDLEQKKEDYIKSQKD